MRFSAKSRSYHGLFRLDTRRLDCRYVAARETKGPGARLASRPEVQKFFAYFLRPWKIARSCPELRENGQPDVKGATVAAKMSLKSIRLATILSRRPDERVVVREHSVGFRDKKRSKLAALPAVTRCGFTIVELLVVIAITGVLLSILMPSLMRAKALARRLECTSNLRQIYVAVGLYLDAHDNAYPCAQDPVSTSPFYWLWMGRGWRGFLEPYLDGSIDVNNPSVLLCPADRTDPDKYESTSYGYSMAFYHSPEQIDTMNRIEDTYTNPQPSIPQKQVTVGNPSGKILIGEWFSNHRPIDEDKGWWTWEGTRNYLFADGQVRYLAAKQIRPARNALPDANLTFRGIKGTDYPR